MSSIHTHLCPTSFPVPQRPLSADIAAHLQDKTFSYAKGGIINVPVNALDKVPTDALRMACAGNKIQAIKMLRSQPESQPESRRMSLKEAKDLIDAAVNELAPWERDLLARDFKSAETVYVSGPMRGKPGFNYPQFRAIAANQRAAGKTVNCPAENFGGDSTRKLSEYMAKDLRMVLESDAIILMPGWRNSEGARLEASMAKALGRKFYEAVLNDDDGVGVNPHLPGSWRVYEIETPETTGVEGPDTEARSLVYGARNVTYGPPALDFEVIGRIWAAILSAHLQRHVDDIPPDVTAVMLSGMKLGRQGRTPEHHDSNVDVIGYQLCLDRIVTKDGQDG